MFFATGGTAGSLIQSMGYVNFYLLTTIAALPGIILFWLICCSMPAPSRSLPRVKAAASWASGPRWYSAT